MARSTLLILALLAAACSESPFGPAPSPQVCGTKELPCPFDCQLGCAAQAVGVAANCALTLEGTLDASRTLCHFADGSKVRFARPLPTATAKLRSAPFTFTIEHGSEVCLKVTEEDSTEAGLLRRATTISGPGVELAQEVWSSAGDGGAALQPELARVRCSDGRYHQGAAGACSLCSDGGCRLSGLLDLRLTVETPLELSLVSGEQVTLLFTCR